MGADVTVLVSVGRHPVSGRLRPAETDSRAIAVALRASAGSIHIVHAGLSQRATSIIRDYVGMGATDGTILNLPADADPVPCLIAALKRRPDDVVLCGSAAEDGEGSGMVPYLLAEHLGRPIIPQLVAIEELRPGGFLVQQALPGGRRRRLLVEVPFVATVGSTGPAPRLSAYGQSRRAAVSMLPASGEADPIAALPSRPASPRTRRLPAVAGSTDAASRLDAILNRGRALSDPNRTLLAGVSPDEAAQAVLAFLRKEELLAADIRPPEPLPPGKHL